MELKQKWKRFRTLNRHHEDGFTLVELVVVLQHSNELYQYY